MYGRVISRACLVDHLFVLFRVESHDSRNVCALSGSGCGGCTALEVSVSLLRSNGGCEICVFFVRPARALQLVSRACRTETPSRRLKLITNVVIKLTNSKAQLYPIVHPLFFSFFSFQGEKKNPPRENVSRYLAYHHITIYIYIY